jgi:hypothetical protein
MSQTHSDPQPDKAAKLSTTEARQGVTLGRMRYVLLISTVLAVIALGVAYLLA